MFAPALLKSSTKRKVAIRWLSGITSGRLYIRAKNARFWQSNFAESGPNRHSFDDLTKIGEEDAPWYCSEQNVYVLFLFVDHESLPATVFRFKDDDLDTLKSVSLYRWSEDCL
jgi:hypothetical protein